jgi:molecular chaperone GrpE
MNDTTQAHEALDEAAEPTSAAGAGDTAASDADAIRAERDAFEDKFLRERAEFDNYRKRVERERRELSEFAASDVLLDLLPLLDDVERALEAAGQSDDPVLDSHRQGLELIQRNFAELLRKRRVTPIDALGADFDPNLHEAVGQEPSDTHREGEIIEQLRRGYRLGDRLLRTAMVKVATRG